MAFPRFMERFGWKKLMLREHGSETIAYDITNYTARYTATGKWIRMRHKGGKQLR